MSKHLDGRPVTVDDPSPAIRDGYAAWTAALAQLNPQAPGDKFLAVDVEYSRRQGLIKLVETEGLTGSRWDPRSEVQE